MESLVLTPRSHPRIALGAVILSLALGATMLKADPIYTYTYTGNDFTYGLPPFSTSDFVSGYFTLSAPLADGLTDYDIPNADFVSVEFTAGEAEAWYADGVPNNSINSCCSFELTVSTSATGGIFEWNLSAESLEYGIGSYSAQFGQSDSAGIDESTSNFPPFAANFGAPGTWVSSSSPSPTPEPGTLYLTLGGLLALALLARKRLASGAPSSPDLPC